MENTAPNVPVQGLTTLRIPRCFRCVDILETATNPLVDDLRRTQVVALSQFLGGNLFLKELPDDL
jgi:hypothetical protein